ncbi:hypothetical protein [Oceaniglobus indicus]|uniref:hypothetical protein n=1 Tax=Oceaniglobus indicus TaxID=2047749 RepID=UPI001F4E8DD7|nr:hypothetical protein [Oceaniglobus indicus]
MTLPRIHDITPLPAADPAAKAAPLLSGLALIGLGFLIRRWRPLALELPQRGHGDDRHDTYAQRAARVTRDGVVRVMPRNLNATLGRSLIIAGAGLIAIRALDALVGDEPPRS